MDQRVGDISSGKADELVWLLEHPPIVTAGTSANPHDLIDPDRFPVYQTGRGGQFTYHGPGQRVVYIMLDLRKRGPDVRRYVDSLQLCIIDALTNLGVKGFTRDGRVGVWVAPPNRKSATDAKIAAIGIRIRRWISFHGLSINIAPELSHYDAIIPCGVNEHGITSLSELGIAVPMHDVDKALRHSFEQVFGPTMDTAAPPLRTTSSPVPCYGESEGLRPDGSELLSEGESSSSPS